MAQILKYANVINLNIFEIFVFISAPGLRFKMNPSIAIKKKITKMSKTKRIEEFRKLKYEM